MESIIDLLNRHGIPQAGSEHRHGRSGWVQINCPLCPPNNKFHLGINLTSLSTNCWKCGRHWLPEVLEVLLRISRSDAYNLYQSLLRQSPIDLQGTPPKGRLKLPVHLEPLGASHKRYLRKRGFAPSELETLWEVQGVGLYGPLKWRIFIPVHYRGEIVSWTTRSISDDHPIRYVSARPEEEKLPLKSLLYGEDYARHSVVIVEGPTDVWRIGPGAVATFGVNYTFEQVEKLSRYPLRVVCFDKTAEDSARELASDLAGFPGITIETTLNADDPGSATDREIREIRRIFLEKF